MFYSYENVYISKVILLLKGSPSLRPPSPTAWRIASVFYLNSTLFCFSYNRQITLVCDVGAEHSLKASRVMELNFSLKLPCFILSQVLQMLLLKYCFHAKNKKCPTATSSGQDEVNLTLHSNWLPKRAR